MTYLVSGDGTEGEEPVTDNSFLSSRVDHFACALRCALGGNLAHLATHLTAVNRQLRCHTDEVAARPVKR